MVVLHQAMRPASHRRIRMVVEIVIDLPAFFVASISMLATTISLRPCYDYYKENTSYQYVHLYVTNLFA